MNSKEPKFLIRLKDGLLYSRMQGFHIMVTARKDEAFKFNSRMAAAQICGLTADFAGASIIGQDEYQDASPRPQEAA